MIKKPNNFYKVIELHDFSVKKENSLDYIFLLKFICCEQIMKCILQWYSFQKNRDFIKLKDISLDGRKIDAALKMYFGHSNFEKNITKVLFQEEDREKYRTAKKIRHRIAHALPEKNDKYFFRKII